MNTGDIAMDPLVQSAELLDRSDKLVQASKTLIARSLTLREKRKKKEPAVVTGLEKFPKFPLGGWPRSRC